MTTESDQIAKYERWARRRLDHELRAVINRDTKFLIDLARHRMLDKEIILLPMNGHLKAKVAFYVLDQRSNHREVRRAIAQT